MTPPTNSDAPAAPDERETRLLLSVTVRKKKSETEMERLSALTSLPQATLDTLSSGGSIQLFHISHYETSNLPFLVHFVPWITENRFSLTHTCHQPSNEVSLCLHYTDLMNGWYSMRLDFRRPILSPLSDDVFCTSRNVNIANLCDRTSANPSNLIRFKSTSELGEDAHQPSVRNLVIPDTVSILPCDQPPEPFALKLYDYQLRTLAWMQGIEDGLDEYYYCPGVKKLFPEGKLAVQTRSSRVEIKASIEDVRADYPTVRAGIIADKPGVGKTITSLALVRTRPCTDPEYLYSVSPNGMLKSRATVFFVPNNICSQWMTEIKKCFGSNIKAIEIKGKIQYDKVSLKEVLECDILVVSYHFLVNKHNISAKLTSQDRVLVSRFPGVDFFNKDGAKAFVDERTSGGGFSLSWIHFHRVVYDEFHEITDKNKALQTQLLLMAGDTMWGLTGTPRLGDEYVICRFADYLKVQVNYTPPVWEQQTVGFFLWKEFYAKDFVLNRVRRNEPEITYPPPIYETIRVTQTAMEYPLYQSCVGRKANAENLVKLCNHYQIANGVVADGSHALTIEQVTEIVQKDRAKRIKTLAQDIKNHQKTLEGRYDLVLNPVSMNTREDAERMYRKAMRHDQEMKEELRSTQSQFNFFDNFLNSYAANNDTISCIVCLEDDVPRDSLGLAPCGHVFCWECAEKVAKVVRTCPHCKAAMTPEKLMKLQPPTNAIAVPEFVEETGDGDTLDPDKFGSKIRELVQYLQREMDADASHRFLVFIQWSDLADLVTQALNTFGIVTARLKNGFQHREAALRQFRAGLESKVAKNETIGGASVQEKEMVQELDDFDKENSEGEEYQPGEEDEFGSDSKRKRKRSSRRVGKEKKKPTMKTSKRNPPSRVLILSAKDSVSGLNLTEATHCIILHPFHDIKEAHAVGAEKQGVARTLRNGQTKTVKIVRLVVENTIEQDMHDRRAPTMTLNDVI